MSLLALFFTIRAFRFRLSQGIHIRGIISSLLLGIIKKIINFLYILYIIFLKAF